MKSILSIQSHVAYGHVGNRAAVFPLQRLGFDVWAINTVEFSNHTGYGNWRGRILEDELIRELVDGIEARGVLASCDAVLSGYAGSAHTGAAILDTVHRIKSANSQAIYCLDPVMGDVGRGFFVADDIPDFMKQQAVPAADILTPNQFELSFLADQKIDTLQDALAATAILRARGPKAVLVTSLMHENTATSEIEMLLDTEQGAFLVSTPILPLDPAPNGAGDTTAALLLAALLDGFPPETALARTADGIYAIFEETVRQQTRELQLIAAQDRLSGQAMRFRVQKIRE